ncbi:MAG TPA: TIR domain-containing protein [Chthoniobacteraceae bacterium]|jgi:Leucine-rich repeat (LRR) protein|nr:TIR domain-containing protein [Chthoniobacteraceae bacterium]
MAERKDFFISYNKEDRAWAEWTAWHLEEAGYSVVIEAWDFGAGSNFVVEVDTAIKECDRIIAVLSPNYLTAIYTQPEWAAYFAPDPTGARRKILTVRVGECETDGLLKALVYTDLVGLPLEKAKAALLEAVKVGRRKPEVAPSFPGRPVQERPPFPGPALEDAGPATRDERSPAAPGWRLGELRNLIVSAALLVLLGAVFGYLRSQSPLLQWVAGGLAALCVVVLVWELVLLVRQRQRNQTLRDWIVKPLQSFREDYFRVGPYEAADAERFHRADRAEDSVLAWVRSAPAPILYLSGFSGTGKSSLINAALLPALRAGGAGELAYTVVRVREFGAPLAQLRAGLLKPGAIWETAPMEYAEDPIADVLAAACRQLRETQRRLLLLFDQFEVVLLRHDQASPETAGLPALLAALRAEAATRFGNLTVLLAFRTDYEHLLRGLGLPRSIEDENSKRLTPFSRRAAQLFLTSAGSGLQLGDERVRAVLDEAEAVDGTRGLIRPIVLNMLGKLLQRLAGRPPEDVPRGALLSGDLRAAVEDPRVRAYARPILRDLLLNGIRIPRTVAATAAATGLSGDLVEGSHRVLLEWPLVRSLEHHEDPARCRWEIAHDFIARLLVPILQTPRRTLTERLRASVTPALAVACAVVLTVNLVKREENRNDILARLSTECGIQTSEEDGVVTARASDKGKITEESLRLLTHLLGRLNRSVSLDLSECYTLKNVDGLGELKALETLDLRHCNSLENVDGLRELKSLRFIELSGCGDLQSVEGLRKLKSLKFLDLSDCRTLQNVDVLRELKDLEALDLSNCNALQDLDPLRALTALQVLKFSGCEALRNLEVLGDLRALQSLDLERCAALLDLEGLRKLTALRSLKLGECKALQDADALRELTALESLDLRECKGLQNVDGLRTLKALRSLDLYWCSSLQNIEGLRKLPSLNLLNLENCYQLQNVEAVITKLPKLGSLNLRGVPIHDRAAILALNIKSLHLDEPESRPNDASQGILPLPDLVPPAAR